MTLTRDDDSLDGGADSGRWQQNLVRPCLLLLLSERRSHGYDLMGRMRGLGIDVTERSVYRNLDALKRLDMVSSDWETPTAGPARRVYELTPSGMEEIERSAEQLRRHVTKLTHLLGEFESATQPAGRAARARWRAGRRPVVAR